MSLLLNERPLVLLPQLATVIGLNEAIVLQQIHFLTTETESGKLDADGKRWVYNTPEGWRKWFPFFSINTIRRTLENLRTMGLLLSSQMEGIMRPMFYRVSDSAPVLLKEGKLPPIKPDDALSNSAEPLAQNGHTGTPKLGTPYIDRDNNRELPAARGRKKKSSSADGIEYAEWFRGSLPKDANLESNWKNKWGVVFDEMVRLDKRDPEDIFDVSEWARKDSFWKLNILTPCKLRRRDKNGLQYFDVIRSRMPKPKGVPGTIGNPYL